MIDRYTLPEMKELWSEQEKFNTWLEIEILACEARCELGEVPEKAVKRISEKASVDLKRVQTIEKEVRHDLIAFLKAVGESVGDDARFIHLGLTSYDIEDTALAVRMRRSLDLIDAKLEKLESVLKKGALEYKDTVMIGRTHGMHAQPVTFGLKMALMFAEIQRNRKRIAQTREIISYGKLSGAVGTYAHSSPLVEEYVCGKLGLKPARISTQIIQRDRHAQYLSALAIIASSFDKFSREIRNLQRTEIAEVEEPFHSGQKGSSAMPHKRNPIVSERICGLARVVRANAHAGFENIPLWHERDLTNSSCERIILPDSSILVFYIAEKFTKIIEGLKVNAERMMTNLQSGYGICFSQTVLNGLLKKGVSHTEAYDIVQRAAMYSNSEGIQFKEALVKECDVMRFLNKQEFENLFDLAALTKNVDIIFKRLGIAQE